MLDYSNEAIAEEKEGLYLVGCTTFNPFTNEQFYFLKVGYSKNVKKRLKTGYGTHCPNIFNIANYYELPKKISTWSEAEKQCHSYFKHSVGERLKRNCVEWFQVTKDTYILINSLGQDVFPIFLNLPTCYFKRKSLEKRKGQIMWSFLSEKLKLAEKIIKKP